jgi:hypothetical protein
MEKRIRTTRVRAAITIVAAVLVVAAVWATAALAGGGSSSDPKRSETPAVVSPQEDRPGPTKEDCPDRDRRGTSDL